MLHGCNKIKEMFSTSYSRLLPAVERLIFIDVKNEMSGISIKRTKGLKDIIIADKTPITDRLRLRFQNEVKQYIEINKNK